MSNWKKYTMGALLACMPLAMVGCGSDDVAAPATTTITGKAVKGPINGADVFAYKLLPTGVVDTAIIAQTKTKTDGTGSYTLNVPAGTGAVVVKVVGNATSSYTDDTDATKTIPFAAAETLTTALLPDTASGKFPVENAVTPFTTMAVDTLKTYYTSGATAPKDLQTAITQATQTVSVVATQLGVSDITNPSATGYTAALKIFTKYMLNANQNSADAIATFTTAIKPGSTTLVGLNQALSTAANNLGVTPPPAIIPIVPPDFSDTTAPTVPTVSSTSSTASAVVLSWTASTDAKGVTGYTIYRDGAKVGTSTTTTFTDTGLTASTTYKYTIKAFDAAGNTSAASNEVTVTTPAASTGPNLNITASGIVKP